MVVSVWFRSLLAVLIATAFFLLSTDVVAVSRCRPCDLVTTSTVLDVGSPRLVSEAEWEFSSKISQCERSESLTSTSKPFNANQMQGFHQPWISQEVIRPSSRWIRGSLQTRRGGTHLFQISGSQEFRRLVPPICMTC